MFLFQNEWTTIKFAIVKNGEENRIFIKELYFDGKQFVSTRNNLRHTNVSFIGTAYRKKLFNRYEIFGEDLLFVSAKQVDFSDKKQFIVEEKNNRVAVKTIYTLYSNSRVLAVKKEVSNISNDVLTLENCSPLTLNGIMLDKPEQAVAVLDKQEDITTKIASGAIDDAQCNQVPVFWKAHKTFLAFPSFPWGAFKYACTTSRPR